MANKNTRQARAMGKANGALKNITAHPGNQLIMRNAPDIFKGSSCPTHFGCPGNNRLSPKRYPSNRKTTGQ